ncbi:MAG: PRC-barrel domain-containing protein [Rhodospirillaceae bacterium]|nr:PRC-barrel domain-containing protein [Rhodospirillaceae bacterium]
MKNWLLASTAAVVLGFAPAMVAAQTNETAAEATTPTEEMSEAQIATAECMEALQEFDQEISEEQASGEVGTVLAGSDFRQLREAARVFANNGNLDGCLMIIDEMRDLYAERREAMEEAAAAREEAREEAREDAAAATEDAAETEEDMAETERLSQAMPLDHLAGLVRADQIIGVEVRNTNDEYLGEIDSIVLDPAENQVAYLLMAHGGFIGIGEDWIPVPWSDLRVTAEGDVFVLDIPEEALETAPTIDVGAFNTTSDVTWDEEVDQWWDEAVATVESGVEEVEQQVDEATTTQ